MGIVNLSLRGVRLRGSLLNHLNRGDEAVAYAGNRFDVPGVLGRVTEGLAKFLDGTIQTVLEIHECVRGPQPFLRSEERRVGKEGRYRWERAEGQRTVKGRGSIDRT